MPLTVSCGCWFLLSVSLSTMELLQDSHCLQLLLAYSHCFYGPMEMLAASHCLPWLMDFSQCLFQFQGVDACL